MPNYWSGTACRGWATATVVGTPQPNGTVVVEPTIVEARFYIGNQLVHTSRPPVGGPLLPSVSFDYRWDSTHFADGSTIKLRIEVVESTEHAGGGIGGTVTTVRESVGREVINRITFGIDDVVLANNSPFPQLASVLCSGGRYSAQAVFIGGTNWGREQMLNALAGPTTHFVFSGHGGLSGSGAPALQMGDGTSIVSSEVTFGTPSQITTVEHARMQALNIVAPPSDLPPMNSGHPPIGIATIGACDVFAFQPYYTNTSPPFFVRGFEVLLYPQKNWYSPFAIENQAVIGYTVEAHPAADNAGMLEYYIKLIEGYTIDEARQFYIDRYNNAMGGAAFWTHIDTSKLTIQGDFDSKFRGVYKPGSASRLAWYTSNSASAPGGPGL